MVDRINGELVVWERDRVAFERLQQRLARRGAAAAQAAPEWPAHFVAFDLVHRGDDLTGWPYARRRAASAAWAKQTVTNRCPAPSWDSIALITS
ncbi:DNA ligase-like domain-containing protein [Streptomyces cellulosae]|uniref:ATP-dependent DNA ligase family profile domain-containing protein n=1 Tax=Streptomyces cellulosae TaxID=1968 RepID=A0ABW7YCV7_STRCE